MAYITDSLVLKLDGTDNTGSSHSVSAATWKDLTNTVSDAIKNAGVTTWGNNYLSLDGTTRWSIAAPNGSFGTAEIVVKIDGDFSPANTDLWYLASTILGCELGGTQKDWAIIITRNGYFGIGYNTSTIYTSAISAMDGKVHTITYEYISGALKLAIDGVIITTIAYTPSGTAMSTLGIGWNYSGSGSAIKGNIYGIRFYSDALTTEEIAQNHTEDADYYDFVMHATSGVAVFAIPDIQALTDYKSSSISWAASTPEETSVTVSAACGATTPADGDYQVCTNGNAIPCFASGEDLTGMTLYIKVALSTTDNTVTPSLSALSIMAKDTSDDNVILLKLNNLKRFHNVEGNLTVSYDASIGTLAGAGGPVESFSKSFFPADLVAIPNPNDPENIEILSLSATGTLTRICYTDVQNGGEYIEITAITATGTLTHIDDL